MFFYIILIKQNKEQEINMLGHSKTAEHMLSNINKIKQERNILQQKIKDNIIKNTKYFEPTIQKHKYLQKIFIGRQKSIEFFQKKLNHKLKIDDLQNKKLEQIQYQTIKKKQQLQKKIQEINNRNQNRMKELNDLKVNVIHKIQNDLTKNAFRQKKLKVEYDRVKSQEKQLKKQNVQQRKSSLEQWKILQLQKWRLENLMKANEDMNQKLMENKNPIANKKDQKKKAQKYIPTQKQYIKLKSPATIDPKQMGRQYLQQAKMMQRQIVQNKSKKKMMNINLKVINYGSDIMQRIYRNTSDLSKFKKIINIPIQEQLDQQDQQEQLEQLDQQEQIESVDILPVSTIIEEQPLKRKFQYILPDDPQTQRYLKQIKHYFNELLQTKNIKNPQNNGSQAHSDDKKSSSASNVQSNLSK